MHAVQVGVGGAACRTRLFCFLRLHSKISVSVEGLLCYPGARWH